MSNKEFRGYTVEFDNDPSHDPEQVEYLVYDADEEWVGVIYRFYNVIETYSVQYGGTTYRRSSTSEWVFEYYESGTYVTQAKVEFEASEFKTYRSAFKEFVNMGWLHYGFDRISTKTVVAEAEPDHSQPGVESPAEPSWLTSELELKDRFEKEGLDFWEYRNDLQYSWNLLEDTRYELSYSPSVLLHELQMSNRTTCPHPDCGGRSENRFESFDLLTRVIVEGGEDYCLHHGCTWTEAQGEHFAKASEVCAICNRLFSKHNGSEALECLESLTIQGLNQGEHDDTTPYTVDDSTGWLS